MSLMEMTVSFLCLVGGYALVSWLMGRGQPPGTPRAGEPPNARESPRELPAESWWTVLGVAETTDLASAQAAYRSLIAHYHPDKVAGMGAEIIAVANQAEPKLRKIILGVLAHEARRSGG